MARSKGEGSIYYIEKRKKWSAQYTITVGDKQVRKNSLWKYQKKSCW